MDSKKYGLAVENIRKQLKDYIKNNYIKALVVGESGGIDSAICSVLAAPVCRELNIPLIGRSITIETNKPDEIDRGQMIGEAFCDDFQALDLTSLYKESVKEIDLVGSDDETDRQKRVRLGNMKARLRMMVLYNLAQLYRGMVLSTDNYTEYLLGFWTLHGDVGDYGMIQELWKTEVYEMSQYLVKYELKTPEEKAALQACIDATPTDGLGITGSDLEQLEANSYNEVDQLLMSRHLVDAPHEHPVLKRHKNSTYKRSNPFNLPREKVFGLEE